MQHTSKILLNTVIALAGLCSSLPALDVCFVPLNKEIASRMIAVRDNKALHPLKELFAMRRTKTLSCAIGENPLQLVALDREDDSGTHAGTAIKLPPGLKSALVLILPDEEHPSGLRAIAMEDDDKSFQWGDLLFINNCKSPYMLQIEKKEYKLPADQSPVIIHPGGDMRNMSVRIYKEDEPEKKLFSSVWEYDPNLRNLLVLVPPKNEKLKDFDIVISPQDRRVEP